MGRDRVSKVIAEMLPRLEEAVQFDVGWRLAAELDAATPGIRDRSRRELSAQLNASLRRVTRAETPAEWASAVLDAAAPFAGRVLLFTLSGGRLAGHGVELPLAGAPAFANAVESRDAVVALRTAGELSAEIFGLAGASNQSKCYLFPVRAAAVLYADGEVDANALELIAAVSGAAAPKPGAEPEPETTIEEERARQFARVQVAEMVLRRGEALRGGRETRTVYAALREEIDSARDIYARKFASEQDHLHEELVRTLVQGDAAALGEDYPGPSGQRPAG